MFILCTYFHIQNRKGTQKGYSCLSILQVHLLISSHSWIKRLFWWHFLLNTAARYTQAARTSKITPRREWRPYPFAIAACFVSTAFPIFSWSCSVPEVYLTLKTRLLGVPHQKLQRRTEKAQDIYIFLQDSGYPILIFSLEHTQLEYWALERVSVPTLGCTFIQLGTSNP